AGTTLVVSRSHWSSDHAPVRPAVQGGGESRGAAQGGLPSFAASFLRNPSARGRQGHSADPGVARTREARHDGALHPRGDGNNLQDREPARPPDHAAPQAGNAKRREAAGAIAPAVMVRAVLEVADILRKHGPAWREA